MVGDRNVNWLLFMNMQMQSHASTLNGLFLQVCVEKYRKEKTPPLLFLQEEKKNLPFFMKTVLL